MKDTILKLFKGTEFEKREMLNCLMYEWEKEVENNRKKDGRKNNDCYFNADGFFPGYFNQKKKKVVFIGREARWVASGGYKDYIANFINWFKENNDHNQRSFTRRVLQIIDGIKNNGTLKFEEVKEKTANGIAKEMVKNNDYGYAMINISKYSNEKATGGKADIELINKFLKHSPLDKRNYFQDELFILDPDIIITGNLWDGKIDINYLDLCFGERKKTKEIRGKATEYEIHCSRKKIKLIDVYHFSYPFVKDKEYYYDPIMKLIFKTK